MCFHIRSFLTHLLHRRRAFYFEYLRAGMYVACCLAWQKSDLLLKDQTCRPELQSKHFTHPKNYNPNNIHIQSEVYLHCTTSQHLCFTAS